MRFSETKKIFATFVVILMMTSIAMLAMPASAQNENIPHGGVAPVGGYVGPTTKPSDAPANTIDIPTNPYLSLTPNPIGVNEPLLVNFWITPPPSNDRFLAGFTVTITKPDGTTDTIGPLNSYNADGTNWASYTVTQVGNYTFKFAFAGEYFPSGRYVAGVLNNSATTGSVYTDPHYYEPATSPDVTLSVVDHQILSYPPAPLPTSYWARPISPDNREWYTIGGPYPWPWTNWDQDWMGPYITAPSSCHIAWSQVQTLGGIIGGDTGKVTVTTTPSYPTVIYDGRGYATYNKPGVGSVSACYDMRTGKIYYEIPGGVTPAIVAYVDPYTDAIGAEHPASYELLAGTLANGGFRSVGSQLIKIDPLTGLVTTNVTGMAGTFYNGHYVLSVQTLGTGANIQYRLINWTTAGTSSVFASRIVSNISTTMSSAPQHLTDFDLGITVVVTRFSSGAIFGGNVTAWSLKTGQVIYTFSTGLVTPFNTGTAGVYNGKFAFACEDRFWQCYDITTGAFLWKSPLLQYPWGDFWSYDSSSWNNMLFAGSYVGMVAFDWDTGKILWQTPVSSAPFETPYGGEQAWHSATIVADGKLYSYTDEHTATQPLTRGWKWYCFNATTGAVIWSIDGWNSDARTFSGSCSDGYLAAANQYDGTMYVFGAGQSSVTVAAPNVVVPKGSGVVITGTVLDQSPGQPNTPCVSDDSMATQMEYLHMGQPIAGIWGNETITGVPVVLQAIDSNNNVIEIGTTTTNGYYGTFGYTWTPPSEGQYTILAAFAGDDSYGSSGAATTISVGPAPTVAPTATPPAAPVDYMPTLTGILVAVIVAIVVSVIALAVVLRKRA